MISSPLLKRIGGYVDGQWIEPSGDKTTPVINPATGEHLADVPLMSAQQATEAIESARRAMDTPTSVTDRSRWLAQIADLLVTHKLELGRIITMEQGKPVKEAAVEVEYAAGFYRFFSKHLRQVESETLAERPKNMRWTVHHRPAGVAGLITPWNFPLAMLAKKMSAAIGAGCASVTKPAGNTPLTAIALWNLLDTMDIQKGRLNLVLGKPSEIGDVFCSHPGVRLVSFTGSTEVGKILMKNVAPHVKRLALELGGNAPFIVMDDADLVAAADALMANKFRCAGQTCVCANRVYVQKSVEKPFVDLVVERVNKIRVGNGLEPEIDIGPLIDRKGWNKVSDHVKDAIAKGAKLVAGGNAPEPKGQWGNFYPPTVLTGMTEEMRVSREETFGPVVAIGAFDDEDEAIRLSNGTEYGLASYLFTRDRDRAERMIARLKFGHVGLNTGQGPTPEAPFGGMKQSGFGREGGVEGLLEFCESQTVAGEA